jgi:hypothetical protein
MKTLLPGLALAGTLALAASAFAQAPAVGGDSAKGNAPVKAAHTVNDGAAKPGRNSFTEGQARQHIIHAGYASVSNLAKDKDGVWQGMAPKGSGYVNVALDFKGNVTEGGPAAPGSEGSAKGKSTMAKKSSSTMSKKAPATP